LDLVRYYLAIARGALAGIRDRPLVLKRFVNGAEGEAFYQKRAPAKRSEWLRTVTLSFPSGREAEEIVVDDAAGLAWVVNLGCIGAFEVVEGGTSRRFPRLQPERQRSYDLLRVFRTAASRCARFDAAVLARSPRLRSGGFHRADSSETFCGNR